MTTQTVSLEVAKQLKEAGWKTNTYFEYIDEYIIHTDGYQSELYAPQLHEILEELPEYIKLWKQTNGQNYAIGFLKSEIIYNKNPHDAAALLWIWCVENGYIF